MSKYVAIRVSNLRGDQKIPFNAYVRVAGKFILFCREGDSFEGNRLERLKSKKLQRMFVPEDQKTLFDKYMRENIDRAYDANKSKPIDIRTQIIQGSLQAATEDVIEEPGNPDFYAVAVEGAKKFTKFFFAEPECLKAMLEIKNLDFSVAHHGVIVSALALAIAEEMKVAEERPMQMEFLAVGCLLHDIEHNYNNITLSVHPDALTGAEKILYWKHGMSAADRLRGEPFYDPVVIEIIEKHDEKIDASGPKKIKEKDQDVFIQIAAVANAFDQYLIHENLSPKDALKDMLIDKMGLLSLDAMKALQGALKKRNII